MNPVDIVIKNAKIVMPNGEIVNAGLALNDEKITAIAKETSLPRADEVLNVHGKLVMPGIIDAHVHLRDPGLTHKEDFESGSRAAALGGVTTLMDMPTYRHTNIPTIDTKGFEEKMRIVQRKAVVDYALQAAVSLDKLHELAYLKDRGAVSFEIFTAEVPEIVLVSDSSALMRALTKIAEIGSIAGISAVDGQIVNYLARKIQAEGRKDFLAYLEARPPAAQTAAVSKVITIAKYTGTRIHMRLVTTMETVKIIEYAKSQGMPITSEVTPHHLLLSNNYAEKYGPFVKVGPPLVPSHDIKELWTALNEGIIDIIVTDHAPHTKAEKEAGWDDVWKAPAGIAGLETLLPMMLTQVNKGMISLKRFVESTTILPAKIFGMYPHKGVIQVNSDADLIVIDLKREKKLRSEDLQTKAGFTPFNGQKVKGIRVLTFVRGKIVAEESQVIGKPGYGKFIRPTDNQAEME